MQRVASVVAVVAIALSGCGGGGLKHKPPALSGQTATLNLGLPQQALNAPVTGDLPGDQVLHVNVVLKVSDQTLNDLGQKYQKKGSSAVPTDVKKQLGVTDEQIKQIEDYFSSGNIQVKPSKTNTAVTFDVKASVVASLMRTKFVNHKLNGRTYFTPDPAHMPQVPKEVASYILAVNGLDNYSLPPKVKHLLGSLSSLGTSLPRARAARTGDCGAQIEGQQWAGPKRTAQAYGINALWQQGWRGDNMTINVVEMDGFDPNDVQNYESCVGANAKIDTVSLGSAPAAQGETTMDLELIAAFAPNAHIVDYQEDGTMAGDWTAFNAALQALIDANSSTPNTGSVVSVSIGAPEGAMTQDVFNSVNENLRILTQAEHMTVFISSGDCGAYTDGVWNGTPDVSFPASSPYAVGTGGTRLSFSGMKATNEVAWAPDRSNLAKCQNSWGTGGGISKAFQRPDYQQGQGVQNKYSTGYRQIPDVSAAAIMVPVYFQGKWVGSGGTSAAAPEWAAGMSLMNEGMMQRLGGFYCGVAPLYNAFNHAGGRKPFHDVLSGDNGYYQAARGWDATTGLGSPNWPDIYNVLASLPHS